MKTKIPPYDGMNNEYVLAETHRNILAEGFSEIKVASDNNDMDRVKEVVAGVILEIQSI